MEERDIEKIAKHLNKDFHRVNLPRSIGVEDQTKEEWLKRLEDVVPKVLTDCKVSHANCYSNFLIFVLTNCHRRPYIRS